MDLIASHVGARVVGEGGRPSISVGMDFRIDIGWWEDLLSYSSWFRQGSRSDEQRGEDEA